MKAISMIILVGLVSIAPVKGQDRLHQLVSDNIDEVYALSLYPEEIRTAILETTQHPEILVKLKGIQVNTSEAFDKLLQYLPESDQKKYWDLVSQKDLVHELVAEGEKNSTGIREILKDYPESIHETALEYGVQRYKTLAQVDSILTVGDEAIRLLLKAYDTTTRESVEKLLDYPEILYILNDNIELAILVGDVYTKNPDLVARKVDSIQQEASRKYGEEIAEWEKGLKENPQVLKEFEEASAAFNQDNEYKEPQEYDPMYLDTAQPEPEEAQPAEQQQTVKHVYVYYHYPYWLGYPYWYPTAYWYWYPYWYHWGYYYDYNHTIFIVGLPSYYFVSWYFSVPYHHYLYPHFSDYVIRYYRRAPAPSRSGLSAAVYDWERRSTDPVSRQLITNDSRRVERLKEYGRFETDYQERQRVSRQSVTRETYLNQNKKRYPNLTGTERNTIRDTGVTPQRNTIRTIPQNRTYQLNRAQDVHQRTWQRSIYKRSTTPTTRPRTTAPTQRRSTRKRDN